MSQSRDPANDAFPVPQVPDFDCVRPIGEGGFGRVWLAINRTTGQPRAVKVIPRARIGSRDPAGREITSLVRLEENLRCHHPNLLVIHHIGETPEHLFYVMDLADDLSDRNESAHPDYRPATLENRLAAGPLAADACERYARQLLAALACLHEAGMVHRDVKPANCLLLGGALKLGDFGLLTIDGQTVSRLGTVRYMPPDGCMDARADVYAAGLVIYEMLTGLPVERFPSLGDRASQIAVDRRLARLNRLALRACDPDPHRRFCHAQEMLATLTASKKSLLRRSHRMGWVAAAAGTIAAVVLALAGTCQPAPIGVNFVTEPYEATIYLDGRLLDTPAGVPYRTPCTIHGLPTGSHRVVFQWDAASGVGDMPETDGKVDAGTIDFAANRQITVRAEKQ